jgi:hypothetical protein
LKCPLGICQAFALLEEILLELRALLGVLLVDEPFDVSLIVRGRIRERGVYGFRNADLRALIAEPIQADELLDTRHPSGARMAIVVPDICRVARGSKPHFRIAGSTLRRAQTFSSPDDRVLRDDIPLCLDAW